MAIILGIETSCDETAASVYDSNRKKILSSAIFSQISLHEKYGGVVPEIASRSHLKKIGFIVNQALNDASVSLEKVDHIAVTNKPGLAGALLVGLSFAKGLALANEKKIIGIDHLEGHIFSSFLLTDGSVRQDVIFPHICLVASGGHTSIFFVTDFGCYKQIGQTLDDAAGEAFDKIAKLIGLGYPGGPQIEKLAQKSSFADSFSYPRTKDKNKSLNFSFSGLKTAVLYDLVKRGAYDLRSGVIENNLTKDLQERVASSLLVCVADIIVAKIDRAIKLYPEAKGVTFVGGVACNKFLRSKLEKLCDKKGKFFISPEPKYCADNAAMTAFVGGYKSEKNEFDDYSLNIETKTLGRP
jgi:N6-L-threonylcarbamoyladenine synthase